jgi:hypothetical protein
MVVHTPALRRWRQEDREFEASLGSMGRLCLKKKKKRKTVLLKLNVHRNHSESY